MNIKDFFKYTPPKNYNFTLKPSSILKDVFSYSNLNVYPDILNNLKSIQNIYRTDINSDIVTRDFFIKLKNNEYKAFIVYIDGMVNANLVNRFILEPLMLQNISLKHINYTLENFIYSNLLPQNNLKKEKLFSKIVEGINSGNCVLFVDTINVCFNIDIKGFLQRNIDTPRNEVIIDGPQEAFVENIRTNTSLLRRIINNENLIIENTSVGFINKTNISICYMQNIANNNLINEVKYRINNLALDTLFSSGQLGQLIQENSILSIPNIMQTERPDKCAKFLMQGRCIILVNGNPYAIIAPAVLIDFLSSPEDTNLKPLFANFLKLLRVLSYAITLLAPGLFVAITGFHHELLPTELLFSILASREYVPFPLIIELLLMEFSFELIRESGLRVPSPIGGTLGIVGAIILGDAAVSAHLVSPILIIVVAITGLSSFAIPDFAFSFHLRVYRFFFILLGYCAGFIGIGAGLLIYINILCSMRSFGVNYTSPLTHTVGTYSDRYFIKPIWKNETRQNYILPKKKKSAPHISKRWQI